MIEWFKWHDTGTWSALFKTVDLENVDPVTALRCAKQAYRGIAVYHGCRPRDINSYLEQGVRPFATAEIHETAAWVLREHRLDVSRHDLALAIERTPKPTEPALVYACVDKRELLRSGTSFSAFGSEHLHRILLTLGDMHHRDYRAILRIGRPAILELMIPWSDVIDYVQERLCGVLSLEMKAVARGEESAPRDWCQAQGHSVRPDQIQTVEWLDESPEPMSSRPIASKL